eukprot:1140065-Pelagomonas_calceolata.AAC.9
MLRTARTATFWYILLGCFYSAVTTLVLICVVPSCDQQGLLHNGAYLLGHSKDNRRKTQAHGGNVSDLREPGGSGDKKNLGHQRVTLRLRTRSARCSTNLTCCWQS